MNSLLHQHTPDVRTVDPRGLAIGNIAYWRSEAQQAVERRITRKTYNAAGHVSTQRDPRLDAPNLTTTYSLSGQPILTDSVDANWRLMLFGEGSQPVSGWDSNANQRHFEYDQLLRPVSVTEQHQVVERFAYGGPDSASHNLCGRLSRHDDTAGTSLYPDHGLSGKVLNHHRYFLRVSVTPDWPLVEAERDALLEPAGLQTRWGFNALGEALAQTDAMANTQAFGMTVAGQLKAASLTLAGASTPQTLVGDIHYNAFNQVEQETAGNGVVSRYTYDQQHGRLAELGAVSAEGTLLQKLDYDYDPVGNVLLVSDASQPDQYCDNQLIEPISRFEYDTLYQLIEASGREVRNGASHGPALPGLQPLPTVDPCQVSNYTQSYSYDTAGNLLQMRHEGAHNFTRNMHVAPDNNRSLPDDDGEVDFATSFDANGNLLQLLRGQVMGWDVRNQLQRITTVQREDGPNDEERYVYDGQGQRCRKISTAQASGRTLINEVRYLPGLEIRTTADGEILHVITAQAGRSSVRVLHWQAGKPDAIANDQVRYSLSDHLGSSTLELDQQGGLISQESYYPFGGTSWWAARSAVEAKYKTVRYSGKERDASGLYYYGFRYYAPWLQRWINPDPAGDVDGLNPFTFVRNNPLSKNDHSGLVSYNVTGLEERLEQAREKSSDHYRFIESNLRHKMGIPGFGDYSIGSRQARPGSKASEFVNTYTPDEWTFHMNYNRSDGQRVYYANEVAVMQYTKVAEHHGFFGQLPSRIIRENISNEETLRTLSRHDSAAPDFKEVFFSETLNGKTTKRILEDFGLAAIRVDKVFKGNQLDIHIHVEPEKTSAMQSNEHEPVASQGTAPPLPTSKPPVLSQGLQHTFADTEDTPPPLPLTAPPQRLRKSSASSFAMLRNSVP
ncbi:RHS repeat domain-containing protein [Pseudomonas syringae]|uniref:RHS repeat domain-containing protein n=1 Tax=Pseudomonas syringae TaxID=317 RepID=UPI001F323559|nr:RHS repeat-associated core domain-containing protein [Pseudomonas syringae]MCF5468750.1 toxin [Pseudomonas syringae]MCF5475038.1 toxin [Pseudomonas syringae]MCF5519057.1 toxin [Pseudomonas syringae]MCF5604255.1 toxin [Pseudomonas syringae]MCF5608860.1 toxin [Pseudomonas syringae]